MKSEKTENTIHVFKDPQDIAKICHTNQLGLTFINGFFNIQPYKILDTFILSIESGKLNTENEDFLTWLFLNKDINVDELRQEFLSSHEVEETEEQ
jgi:hypothetical protein